MRLAEPSAVLQATGVQENPGSLANALAALDLTAPIIEGMLDSALDEQVVLDEFDFKRDYYPGTYSYPSFRLSRGFVNREETVTISGSGVTGYEDLATYWTLDYERGVLAALFKPLSGAGAVKIQYTAGFPQKGTNKVLDTTPEWLKQAGIMAAVHYLQITPANIANKQNISMKDVTDAIRVMLSRVINPKSRPRLNLEFAARSQTIE